MVELAVAVLIAALAVIVRALVAPMIGQTAPYAFIFAAVTLAAILGGWRSGLMALVIGQALTVYAVVMPIGTFYLAGENLAGFIAATVSELILLLTIALYQREVDKGTAERERRLALMDEALREIDHRTRNNYQTVLAMIELQTRRSKDEQVRDALRQVGARIQALADASKRLAARSPELDSVKLDDHLCELVSHIERGLAREEIKVECEVEDVTASADKATSISIIVNELVTNAIKHAFNGEGSGSVVVKGRAGSAFELIIADDGRGMKASKRDGHSGLGSQLVKSFAKQLGAKHEIESSEAGTTHRLEIPDLH